MLLKTNRKAYARFQLVKKSTTLEDLEGHYALWFRARVPRCSYLFIFSSIFSLLLIHKWLPAL